MDERVARLLIYLILAVLAVIGIGIAAFVTKKYEKNMTNNHFTVRLPVFEFLMWLFFTLLSVAVLIVLEFALRTSEQRGEIIGTIIIFSLILLLGLFQIASYIYWEVEVIEHTIHYRPFGKLSRNPKTFTFCMITRAEIDQSGTLKLFLGDKELFSMCKTSRGYSFFENRLKEEGVFIEFKRSKKGGKKKMSPAKSSQQENVGEIKIHGFGCFKVDIDPRNVEDVRTRDDLYFFLDGTLEVSGDFLVFNHSHHTRNDHFTTEIEIKKIRDFKWRTYDKANHDVFGEEIRYLVRGAIWALWREVGYYSLPGGRSTEMECIITDRDGRESYFYFSETHKNMSAIEEMRRALKK